MALPFCFISLPGSTEWMLVLIGLAVLFYWIRAIAHVAGSRFESTNIKAIWLVVVILFGVLRAFIYDVAGRQSVVKAN